MQPLSSPLYVAIQEWPRVLKNLRDVFAGPSSSQFRKYVHECLSADPVHKLLLWSAAHAALRSDAFVTNAEPLRHRHADMLGMLVY